MSHSQDPSSELEEDCILNNGRLNTEEDLKQLKEPDDATKQNQQDEREEWNALMTDMITQMMFVSGETAEPSPETTTIIEEIVREQVVEMVSARQFSEYRLP